MKMFKNIFAAASVLLLSAAVSSCNDSLTLTPDDTFTSSNFWQTQEQFEGNVVAIHNQLRGFNATRFQTAGDLRGGQYKSDGTTSDGSSMDSGNNPRLVSNTITADYPGLTTFGGYYGVIANLNLLIERANETDVLSNNCRNYLLGVAYGLRASCFFEMYRLYGGVPLRINVDVVNGNYNTTDLYLARATHEETINQIKSDLQASLDGFANAGNYSFSRADEDCYYWNEAATKVLAGEVYLWDAKVAYPEISDANYPIPAYKCADPDGNIAKAKEYFLDVLNNYGYSLNTDFAYNFDVENEGDSNHENIFALCYSKKESYNYWVISYIWSNTSGSTMGNAIGADGNWIGYTYDAETDEQSESWYKNYMYSAVCKFQYSNALYFQFDAADSRRDATFYPAWFPNDVDKAYMMSKVENFDPNTHYLRAAYTYKFRGEYDTSYSARTMVTNDFPWYRLSLVYCYLAEIANWQGDYQQCADYINVIRKRAYGSNWDESKYGYKAGAFRDNEIAILHEKDKEFVQEGQRWWDLRRLTVQKNGNDSDHLLFQPEGNVGYGLALTQYMKEGAASLDKVTSLDTSSPVLDYSTKSYMALWPVNKTLMSSDPTIIQNPGY
jgi:hypothetical protein